MGDLVLRCSSVLKNTGILHAGQLTVHANNRHTDSWLISKYLKYMYKIIGQGLAR
jgi:hypothetical protein